MFSPARVFSVTPFCSLPWRWKTTLAHKSSIEEITISSCSIFTDHGCLQLFEVQSYGKYYLHYNISLTWEDVQFRDTSVLSKCNIPSIASQVFDDQAEDLWGNVPWWEVQEIVETTITMMCAKVQVQMTNKWIAGCVPVLFLGIPHISLSPICCSQLSWSPFRSQLFPHWKKVEYLN